MTGSPARPPPQFGLRWLFGLTAAVAVCAFVYRQAGRDEAIGVAIAFGLLAFGLVVRQRRWLRRTAFVAAGLAAWIATVDYVQYYVSCDHCRENWFVREVRFLRRPLWSQSRYETEPMMAHVLEDLGQPCAHRTQHHLMLWRFWGLIVPQVLFSGTLGLAGDDWYDSRAREIVRQFGAEHPDKGRELSEALARKDHLTIRAIMTDLRMRTAAP